MGRAEQVLTGWRWLVSGGLLIAWLLLAVGGVPKRSTGVVAAGGLLFLLALLPLQEIAGLESIFEGTLFAFPPVAKCVKGCPLDDWHSSLSQASRVRCSAAS
ncbi:MAG: hypothetical protein Ct9H300mP15_09540 [Gemmatimonadota bacterium]|nr:MAG: hypothetical protein Ct9H300mP15_09540 [Gemmatimonadota bacterium]